MGSTFWSSYSNFQTWSLTFWLISYSYWIFHLTARSFSSLVKCYNKVGVSITPKGKYNEIAYFCIEELCVFQYLFKSLVLVFKQLVLLQHKINFGFENLVFVGQVKRLTNLTEEIVIKVVFPYLLISLVLFPCMMFLSLPFKRVIFYILRHSQT